MLRIKHKHRLSLPHLTFHMPHTMQLSPVMADDDELVQEIDAQAAVHENDWELVERPDTNELEQFWITVEDDVKNDPEWNHFAEE